MNLKQENGLSLVELLLWTGAVSVMGLLSSHWCQQISRALPMTGSVTARQNVNSGLDHMANDLKEADASNFSATSAGGTMINLNLPTETPWFRKQALTGAGTLSYVQYVAVPLSGKPGLAALTRYETTQYPPSQAGASKSVEIPEFCMPTTANWLLQFDQHNGNILILLATYLDPAAPGGAPLVQRVIRRVSSRGNDGTYAT